jgi:hypothetical protein
MRSEIARRWAGACAVAFCLAVAAGCGSDDDDGGGAPAPTATATATVQPTATPAPVVFNALLSGDQEVPVVETLAAGTAAFTLSEDEASIDFEVGFSGIEPSNVLQAHLHIAPAGENGPVAIFLIGQSPTSNMFSGTLDDAGFVQNAAGVMTIADLVTAIEQGRVYANVHTRAFPAGEIRGQLSTD